MNRFLLALLILALGFVPLQSLSQTAVIKGKIKDDTNNPISDAVVEVFGTSVKAVSGADGSYSVTVPAPAFYRVEVRHAAHLSVRIDLRVVNGAVYDRPIVMLDRENEEVTIVGQESATDISRRNPMMQLSPLRMEDLSKMPAMNPSGEAFVKNLPGVASNNEFSSQYQVRGGNFDENLVYVNGIEIYRPFLARAGQQEGLGFSNPMMIQSLAFSAGGFAAQYGDRLSSVLDLTYRNPKEFRATAEVGFITTNLHAEGAVTNDKGTFTWLTGARRFAMSYFLNSLETRGDYRPNFMDVQGLFSWSPNETGREDYWVKTRKGGALDTVYAAQQRLKVSLFVAGIRNRFFFEPTGRETTTGTIQRAFRLRVGFEGREISTYTTGLAALTIDHKPSTRLQFNYILTTYRNDEQELVDVEGGYLLGEVNTNFGSEEFNESDFDLGIGSEFRHSRNYLSTQVVAAEAKGLWYPGGKDKHLIRFGLRGEYQFTDDDLKEYTALDSAGYFVDQQSEFDVIEYIRARNSLTAWVGRAYAQHEWRMDAEGRALLVTGARLIYHSVLEDWHFSPRVQFSYDLRRDGLRPLSRLRLASGIYHQMPFYREYRRFDGSLNLNINAQRSIHLIGGLDHQFKGWGRPFLLYVEAYYKWMYDLIPFESQNVRLRYYPDNPAVGYAYGLDMRVNGEFIRGVDSWMSLSLLRTEEFASGEDQDYVSRPTDQRVTFAMYFQDELPTNPTFKVHVNYVFGSGMRFGPPNDFQRRTFLTYPPYHRVDLGFSKLILVNSANRSGGRTGVESLWATLEIFNLFQRQNTVSYVWIKDLQNNNFAIPNRLSARLINLRIIVKLR